MNKLKLAKIFSKGCHHDQKRKYTGEPYFNHCDEVANLVADHGGNENMIVAAFLHDTVEDCDISLDEIEYLFGQDIAYLVFCLTDISKPYDGNRATRKEKDRLHLSMASNEAKTIKLADLISNTKSIVEHDKDFAKVYLREKELLLHILSEGNPELFKLAQTTLIQAILQLKEENS